MYTEDIKERKAIRINFTYPRSEEFDFESRIENIDFDKECQLDLDSGNGFVISSPQNTNKKEMKNENGIYSYKFGRKIGDGSPFSDRYSCECGATQGKVYRNTMCPICRKKVKYVSDNFNMFGWIVLKDKYHMIHPKFYETINYILGNSQYNTDRKKMKGTKLENILNFSPEVDADGKISECKFKPDKEPFYGIGMMAFYDRFDEIMNYYLKLNPKKKPYYDELMANRNIVFTHCIPVFTTHLRPSDVRDEYMCYEPSNAMYNMINKHVHAVNKDTRRLNRDVTMKNMNLYKAQKKYMELVNTIITNLQGKKGNLRMLIGGRYNYSCRAVIRQDASLSCDQVILPYVELVTCLEQVIINILMKTYNISPSDAFEIWSNSRSAKDRRVTQILDALIKNSCDGQGIPVIINRNPSINYGNYVKIILIY